MKQKTQGTTPPPAPGLATGQLRTFAQDSVALVRDIQRDYGGVTRLTFSPLPVHVITECARDLVAGWEAKADRGELVDVTEGFSRIPQPQPESEPEPEAVS